jgi:acyl transferase domain-containing protein
MPRTPEQLKQAAAEAEAWLDSLGDDVHIEDPTDLREIAKTVAEVAAAEERLAELVRAARENGRSWGRIAMALGVSKQAARQRFREDAPTSQ